MGGKRSLHFPQVHDDAKGVEEKGINESHEVKKKLCDDDARWRMDRIYLSRWRAELETVHCIQFLRIPPLKCP
jgi:hypothetical protein